MLLQLLVPDLQKIERRLELTKQRAARSRESVRARREHAVRKTSAAIRSPEALALAAVTGFAGGRIASTSRRLRMLEDQLATIERLVRQTPESVAARSQASGRGDRDEGLDLQALLANVSRLATLVSLITSSQTGSTPAETSSPEGVAAATGD